MAKWTYETTRRGYENMWSSIEIKPSDFKGADNFARKIMAGEAKYKQVEAVVGVPWFFVGALHMRESSCNFAGVLHNGEHIIGTGKKTRLVPRGRGPFQSWSEAAIDALMLKDFHKITEWPASRMGYEAERFNGLGYIKKGVNSAYVWAGSNHEQPGKYVADHVWDKDFDDPQIGVMTVLKRLCQLRGDIAAQVEDRPEDRPMPPDIEPPEKGEVAPKSGVPWWKRLWLRWAGGSVGTYLGLSTFTDAQVAAVMMGGAFLIVAVTIFSVMAFIGESGRGTVRSWIVRQFKD